MAMTNKDKLKFAGIVVLICIPIWVVTPLGYKSMRSWAVTNPTGGSSKFWMSTAILVCRASLRTETSAEYMREYFLLWAGNAEATQKLYTAADLYYGLGSTAEKSDQNRFMTRAHDIYSRMRDGEFTEIKVELDDGEIITYPLTGLSVTQQQEINRRLEYLLETWHMRNMGSTQYWDAGLAETYKFPDLWNKKKPR